MNTTVVVTTKRWKTKELMLAPCSPDPQMWTESTLPNRVVIHAKSGTAPTTTFYIHPRWVHPAEETVASASAVAGALPAVAEELTKEHRVWKWKGTEVMHPMWAVRRLSADELRKKTMAPSFNMEQQWKDVTTTVINGGGDYVVVDPCPHARECT